MLLLVFSKRCFLQILVITRTNGDMSHFEGVGIFNSRPPHDKFWPLTTTDLKMKLPNSVPSQGNVRIVAIE